MQRRPGGTLAHIWMSMGFLVGNMGPRLSTLHMVRVAFLSGGMERVGFQYETFESVALLRAGMGPSSFPMHMWVSVPLLSGSIGPPVCPPSTCLKAILITVAKVCEGVARPSEGLF